MPAMVSNLFRICDTTNQLADKPMPTLPSDAKRAVGDDTFRVLLTGFGENPSWLATKPLHNTVLSIQPPTYPTHQVADSGDHRKSRSIHISAMTIPVTYEAVLDIVPGLHARPPVLPDSGDQSFLPPPLSGYDLIFHIGVAGRGPLRMERLGHKLGYHMKDATGKLASVVRSSPKDFSRHADDTLVTAENIERERLGMDIVEISGEPVTRPMRGFGIAYENFPDEITTDIDVSRLVHDLKRSGIEQIYTSMDAGHYLCDFMYYCSLAEAKRTAKPYEKRRNTQVLFLHCPPVNQPLSTDEVTEAIKRIVVWICQDIQLADDSESHLNEGISGGV